MPRIANHDERRREIAYAVWHLIATSGLERVTMRAVAAEAGMSLGQLQHYVASKDEMLRSALLSMINQADEVFTASTAPGPPLEAFAALAGHAIPTTDAARVATAVWYAYLAKSVEDVEIAAALREAKRGEEETAVRLLVDARQSGQLRTDADVEGIARRVLAMADGLALRVFAGSLTAAAAADFLAGEVADLLGSATPTPPSRRARTSRPAGSRH